jgi:hypothetical protein
MSRKIVTNANCYYGMIVVIILLAAKVIHDNWIVWLLKIGGLF